MQKLWLILLIILVSCEQKQDNKYKNDSIELYNSFEKENHLQPLIDKINFDTSHSWNFGWVLLEPIKVATDENNEKQLSKRLSPGQKALYFFWYLDAEVTNGGFIQFFWNDYQKYVSPIKNGLILIGDTAMLHLVEKADKEYLVYKNKFIEQKQKDNWEPLYDSLKNFESYDNTYYSLHDKTMWLIEKYARGHSQEFIKLK